MNHTEITTERGLTEFAVKTWPIRDRQETRILTYIKRKLDATREELMEAFPTMSRSDIGGHLDRLETRKLIRRQRDPRNPQYVVLRNKYRVYEPTGAAFQ